jgi:hypothetical protein
VGIGVLDGIPLGGRLSRSLDWKEQEERKEHEELQRQLLLLWAWRESLCEVG